MKIVDLHSDELTGGNQMKIQCDGDERIVKAVFRGDLSFSAAFSLAEKESFVAFEDVGYPDLDEIMYAIIETNGKICVVEKAQSGETFLPVSVILNGKWQEENVAFTGLDKNALIRQLDEKGNKVCDLVYADVRQNGSVYCAPENGACYTLSVTLSGGGSW